MKISASVSAPVSGVDAADVAGTVSGAGGGRFLRICACEIAGEANRQSACVLANTISTIAAWKLDQIECSTPPTAPRGGFISKEMLCLKKKKFFQEPRLHCSSLCSLIRQLRIKRS